MPVDPLQQLAVASQLLIVAIGLILAWKLVFSPAIRATSATQRLPAVTASLHEVALLAFHGLAGGFIGSLLVGLTARTFGLAGDQLTIAATAALHLGILCGVALFFRSHSTTAPAFGHPLEIVRSGLATFAIAMPFVALTNLAWLQILKFAGYDVARQPAVEMVGRLGASVWMALFILFAVVVAPIAEELLFRAGLFRFLRSRVRPSLALVAPSLLFASIHLHLPSFLPLAVLGIIFSLAYQRTGTIGTAIVAHGAFNLNNLLMLLSGVGQ